MYYLKLIWTFFRIGILNEMAYRVNFYVQLLQSLLSLGTAIAGLAIVFSHTDTLGGWQAVDILALLGVFMVVGGVIGMVISPSMSQLMDDVRLGLFDYTLTKPCDAQFLASISQIRLWRLTDILLGAGVLIAALIYRGLDIGSARSTHLRLCSLYRGQHHLQLLAHARHPHLLVLAHRKHPPHLPEHVRSWPLAHWHLPTLAALYPHIPRTCGICHHSTRRSTLRSPDNPKA